VTDDEKAIAATTKRLEHLQSESRKDEEKLRRILEARRTKRRIKGTTTVNDELIDPIATIQALRAATIHRTGIRRDLCLVGTQSTILNYLERLHALNLPTRDDNGTTMICGCFFVPVPAYIAAEGELRCVPASMLAEWIVYCGTY
jgi:hypothetical protein